MLFSRGLTTKSPVLLFHRSTPSLFFFNSTKTKFMGGNMSRSAASQTALPSEKNGKLNRPEAEWQKILTPAQYAILRQKGTEPRHRGEYDEHFVPGGIYICAGCKSPLYKSEHKFDCGCGWPGFWTNISKAVLEQPESDGSGRVEILCNYCFGHLGHVFRGEGFSNPQPNERHCVNSLSLKFLQKSLEDFQRESSSQQNQGQ